MTPFDAETGRAASLSRWAFETDRQKATSKARRGFLARFEEQVDPAGELDPQDREERARRLMRAHMIGLARKSRAKRAAARLRKSPS